MTLDMIEWLRDCARTVAARTELGAVLIDAEGHDFCAGVDLAEFDAIPDAAEHARRGVTLAQQAIAAFHSIPVPVITAVQGSAAGGGLGIALSGDIVLAASDARFIAPYSQLGLSPDGGVSWQLVRLLGSARATDALLTGRPIVADEIFALGLVSRLYPRDELRFEAEQIATDLANGPTAALIATKRLARSASAQGFEDQLRDELESFARLGGQPDQIEGVAAFVERRPPAFNEAESDEGTR
ncbi:enoyl-CoA hydratase-related protein [Gordonia caeni]|uniref:Enoyl-CoA hydratase-related protein n=2 Tax=Gordonia caeni TaxID=1007097 RepID=A0ABP7NV37_9ACTN